MSARVGLRIRECARPWFAGVCAIDAAFQEGLLFLVMYNGAVL